MKRTVKAALYIFAGWFIWLTWGAIPHFSGGFQEGIDYYRQEAVATLDEFSAAGERILGHAKSQLESYGFYDRMQNAEPVSGRYTKLETKAVD